MESQMNKIFLTSLLSSIVFAGQYRGHLIEANSKKMADIIIEKEVKRVELEYARKYEKYLDHVLMNSKNYSFEFDGELEGNKLVLDYMPRVVADIEDKIGVLTKVGEEFYLDGTRAKFGRTKPIYGFKFDEKSKNYFVGKKVHTQGHSEDGVFIINAIIPADLFSVSTENAHPASEKFNDNPLKFITKKMPKTKNSQSLIPFRGTLRQRDGHSPKPGDNFFLVTLSGRQGDEPGASAGHYAIGMGTVAEDMSLKGETFNFYFEGEKEVLASNTDLVSYYGHLIQGQVNYRPTYTLISYGRSKEELLKMRDMFELQLHRVRTEKGLTITPFYNCTTTSNDVAREFGIKGNHEFLINNLFDYQTYLPLSQKAPDMDAGMLKQLLYILKRDSEHYVPRGAFESFAKSMTYQSKKLKFPRTDYIFLPQTPSARPMGGISYNDVLKEGKKIIDFKDARLERIKKENEARETLKNPSATDEQIAKAREILENAPTPEEDQKQIDKILYSID